MLLSISFCIIALKESWQLQIRMVSKTFCNMSPLIFMRNTPTIERKAPLSSWTLGVIFVEVSGLSGPVLEAQTILH